MTLVLVANKLLLVHCLINKFLLASRSRPSQHNGARPSSQNRQVVAAEATDRLDSQRARRATWYAARHRRSLHARTCIRTPLVVFPVARERARACACVCRLCVRSTFCSARAWLLRVVAVDAGARGARKHIAQAPNKSSFRKRFPRSRTNCATRTAPSRRSP